MTRQLTFLSFTSYNLILTSVQEVFNQKCILHASLNESPIKKFISQGFGYTQRVLNFSRRMALKTIIFEFVGCKNGFRPVPGVWQSCWVSFTQKIWNYWYFYPISIIFLKCWIKRIVPSSIVDLDMEMKHGLKTHRNKTLTLLCTKTAKRSVNWRNQQ